MGYVKNEWNTGDVVTAAKLNNIEDGIDKAIEKPDTGNVNDVLTKTENGVKWAPASGGDTEILVVTGEINEDGTLSNVSHTSEQIKAAYESGKVVVFRSENSDYQLSCICDGDRPSECVVFFISSLDPNKDVVAQIKIYQDTSRSICEYFEKNMVPDHHSSQEIGKYLRVNSVNGLEWAPATGGVESVNGKTGTVVLNSNDINDGDDTIHNVLGGKAEKFIVTFTMDDDTEEITCDKTLSEIYTAYTSGKIVEGLFVGAICILNFAGYEDENYGISFILQLEDSFFDLVGSDYRDEESWRLHRKYFLPEIDEEVENRFLKAVYIDHGQYAPVWTSIEQVPSHTSSDDGKVLSVNSSNGLEWKTPSGGGSIPDAVITCYDNGSGGTRTVSCNKTYNELKTIIQNHGRIQMQHRHEYYADAYFIDDVSYCIMDNSDIIFQAVTPDAPSYTGKLLRYMIKVTSENVWTWDFSRFINTPTYNSSDANKVLKVNNNATGVEWGEGGGGGSSITDDQMMQILIQEDMLPVVYEVSGNKEYIFTDNTGKVLLW